MTRPGKIAVVLILGSDEKSKADYLSRLVTEPGFVPEESALVFNGTGPLNSEVRAFRGKAARIISLGQACLCCSPGNELRRELEQIVQDPGIRKLWIQASASAREEDLLTRLREGALAEQLELSEVLHFDSGSR